MRDQIIIALTICLEKTEEIKTSVNINKLQVYDIINNNADIKAVIIKTLLARALTPYDIEAILKDMDYCECVATMININKKEKIQYYGPKDGSGQTTLY